MAWSNLCVEEKRVTAEHDSRYVTPDDDIENAEMLKQICYDFSNAKEM